MKSLPRALILNETAMDLLPNSYRVLKGGCCSARPTRRKKPVRMLAFGCRGAILRHEAFYRWGVITTT